ncbi:MAG TPA: hypothetical protein PKK06_16630 [Phycisphaerae bacterium]|nr:hypothetical protein [Phycisphaerae bacterium]HNU46933.1 hypothetical protein [Phycisphaerae bacterium]
MSAIEQQTRRAQRRLWLNRWLRGAAWSLTGAAGLFALVVLVQRAWGLAWPVWTIGLGLAAAAGVTSLVYLAWTREGAALAAVELDAAAGLRERISSGRYCGGSDDPFAQAVVADAERTAAGLRVRDHLRVTVPPAFQWAGALVLLAALMFLVPVGVMAGGPQGAPAAPRAQAEQSRMVVKQQLEAVVQVMQDNPALQDLKDEVNALKPDAESALRRPIDVQREALKKLDKLADAVKKKREDEKYDAAQALRKALRGLKMPQESDAATQKLAQALARGDFQSAREELKALQEKLATLKQDEDQEMVKKIGDQLNDLARQLDDLAENKQLQQKLAQAGVTPEQMERLMSSLKKQDLDQLQEQLAQQGMSQQQIQQLMQQLREQQTQGSQCRNLSQCLAKGGQCGAAGQMGEAMAGLSEAEQQLSDAEQLEQEMNQLNAALSSLQNAKDGCQGQGQCQGKDGQPHGGMGKLGRGQGGLAPEERTDVAFKVEKQQVHTGQGAIIGQFLVEGEQVRGEVDRTFVEVITAAEHEASDAVNRDRVPRQYQKAVKEYFRHVGRAIQGGSAGKKQKDRDAGEARPDSDAQGKDKSEATGGSSKESSGDSAEKAKTGGD